MFGEETEYIYVISRTCIYTFRDTILAVSHSYIIAKSLYDSIDNKDPNSSYTYDIYLYKYPANQVISYDDDLDQTYILESKIF